jgi:hypothetical protein
MPVRSHNCIRTVLRRIQWLAVVRRAGFHKLREACCKLRFVLDFISAILAALRVFFRGRRDSALEILALRPQLAVFKRKHPRPNLRSFDRLFWTVLRRIGPGWAAALILVKPDAVVRWHRTGFRLYWRWRSRASSCGRPKITAEIQTLIRRDCFRQLLALPGNAVPMCVNHDLDHLPFEQVRYCDPTQKAFGCNEI